MRLSQDLILFFSNTKKMSSKTFPHIRKFDVTMRDGLQSIPRIYTLDEKKIILNKIMNVYKPHSLEIGSIISTKLVPQMKQSYELYNYANAVYNTNKNTNNKNNTCDFYLLVPPTKKYLDLARKLNIRNISLNTSVSNPYQLKHSNQSIEDTKNIIKDIAKTPNTFDNIKLYVSCINNCPIKGKQDNEYIINELYEYLHIDGVSEVCLTDTCGNMRYGDFKHIIDYLNIEMNYKLDKLSLHLHYYDNINNYVINNYTIDNIIQYAINNNINKFDLTTFENIYFGNSIIKVDVKEFNNNVTYNKLYESIYNTFIY
jgi:isopropylmalate/homocitrate/citramalate synthase